MSKNSWYSLLLNKKLWIAAQLFISIIRDYRNGKLQEMHPAKIMLVAFTCVYIISPIDILPDFFFIIGWIDDLLLMYALCKFLHRELCAYCVKKGWETQWSLLQSQPR